MEILEITLLITAYTVIVLALFLEIICYRRNLETGETIAFTAALLLLIVSLTANIFFVPANASGVTNIFTLLCMVLVGLTTILSTLADRQHRFKSIFAKALIIFSGVLMLVTIAAHFTKLLGWLQYVVVVFLGMSVAFSMLLIKLTKPRSRVAHQEKLERYSSIIIMVFIPLYLIVGYTADLSSVNTKIGFTLPLVFIYLAGNKLWDDAQRLSLFKPENNIQEQNLENYALTKREKEVTLLLVKGHTYKQISEQLFISLPTVKTHASNIYRKCQINNRMELISLIGK